MSILCVMLAPFLAVRCCFKQVLFDRNYEDSYSDPGSPMTRRTPLGTYVLAQLAGNSGDSGDSRSLLLQVSSRYVSICRCR